MRGMQSCGPDCAVSSERCVRSVQNAVTLLGTRSDTSGNPGPAAFRPPGRLYHPPPLVWSMHPSATHHMLSHALPGVCSRQVLLEEKLPEDTEEAALDAVDDEAG